MIVMSAGDAAGVRRRFHVLDAVLVLIGISSGLVGNYDSNPGLVSKIIPATYAFAIWVPIYFSGLYFAWWLVRRATLDLGAGAHLLALSFFFSGLWVRVQTNNTLLLVVVASNLAIVLVQGHLMSKVAPRSRSEFFAMTFPSGALAGWLTLATAVTFSDGLNISYRTDKVVAIFAAFAVGFAIAAAKWIVPTDTYRWTLIWGLVGIVVQQHAQASQVAVVGGVGLVLVFFLIVHSRWSGAVRS